MEAGGSEHVAEGEVGGGEIVVAVIGHHGNFDCAAALVEELQAEFSRAIEDVLAPGLPYLQTRLAALAM